MRRRFGTTVAACAIISTMGGAAGATREVEIIDVPIRQSAFTMLPPVRAGDTAETYVAKALELLREADRDGDGLDARDTEWGRLQEELPHLGAEIERVLSFDLDGDRKVTRGEVDRKIDGRPPTMDIWRFDANRDDVVTRNEVTDGVVADAIPGDKMEGLRRLDPNRDGTLTERELKSLARKEFKKFDTDGSGSISPAESGERSAP